MTRRLLQRSRSRRDTFVEEHDLQNFPHPDARDNDIDKLSIDFYSLPIKNISEISQLESDITFLKRQDSCGSLVSIVSEDRSTSSCSWNEDSGSGSSEKIQRILSSIDKFLYEGEITEDFDNNLKDDCLTWAQQFHHLRINGINYENKLQKPALNIDESFIDEIIIEHDLKEDCETDFNCDKTEIDLNKIKEMVLNELVRHVMPRIEEWQKAKTAVSRTPSANFASRYKTNFRPLTADQNTRNILPYINDSSLDGILTVSSKVLQDRKNPKCSEVSQSRPSSSIIWLKENSTNIVYRSQRRFASTVPALMTIPNEEILSDLDYYPSYKQHTSLPLPPVRRMGSSRLDSTTSRPSTGQLKQREIKVQPNNSLPSLSVQTRSKILSPRSSATVRFNN